MPMSKGQKIVAPFLRATAHSGVIHAVENMGDETVTRTACGKVTKGADQPVKRFQSGIENFCLPCYTRVTVARSEKIRERKARYLANMMEVQHDVHA